MDNSFAAADRFLLNQARLAERRLFAQHFLGQPASAVAGAVRGYQNADGGFGHALEPDVRCPASLPIFVECAFQALAAAGLTASDPAATDLITRACDFLDVTATAADAGGAVSPAFPVIESFPRAAHWAEWTYVPGLNPTAGLTGLLYQLDADHPWRAQGEAYCWSELEAGRTPGDAHGLSEVLVFLAHVPDRDRADKQAAILAEKFGEIQMLQLEPGADDYGITPLQLAPAPDSRWRHLFTDAQIDGHLDQLEQAQQPDGGWPVSWEPPSEASALEWRGILTLAALRTLTAYGRLTAPA